MRTLFVGTSLLVLSCGAQAQVPDNKIVGGEEAVPHSIPWQVSLRRKSDNFHFCGGSVVGPTTVVSAAHCTEIWDSPNEVVVVAGEHSQKNDDGTEQTVNVAELIVHESYGSPKSYENDIALWILAEPLEMTDAVQPIAMPAPKQQTTGSCSVSGWGTLHAGGATPDVLMVVSVPVVEEQTCKLEYPFQIAESMLCAGERGKDSCQGDSGGPMVCYNSDGSGYLGGVVSWGIGCGGLFHPGVYTEVSYFVEWIAANTPATTAPPPTEPATTAPPAPTTALQPKVNPKLSLAKEFFSIEANKRFNKINPFYNF